MTFPLIDKWASQKYSRCEYSAIDSENPNGMRLHLPVEIILPSIAGDTWTCSGPGVPAMACSQFSFTFQIRVSSCPFLGTVSSALLCKRQSLKKFDALHYVNRCLDAIAMSDQQQQAGDGATSSQRSTPATTPPSSASSDFKGMQQVELELRLLEAVAIYRPSLLVGMHRHFILFGLMENLERRLNQRFSPDEVLQLLDRFFNLELLELDDEELELVKQEEDFSLPPSIFEEIKGEISA